MGLWRDFRYGLRMLNKGRSTAVAAVLALGLGIGLTTATFSIIYGIMFRGLPFEHGERVMWLDGENPARNLKNQPVDVHDFLDWRQRQTSFEGVAGLLNGTVTISGDGKPERLDGAELTANALDVLKVRPFLGRGFRPGEDRPGAEPVVLLGYSLWQSRYGSDPGVIGRAVRVNGQSMTVIGVMAPDFRYPLLEQLWTPHIIDPGKAERGKGESLGVFARLKAGVTERQAQAEMTAIAGALATEYPRTNKGLAVSVKPFTDQWLGDDARNLLLAMFGSVCCVLLISCINVASLVMSRASQRIREIAIRTALGAHRAQVIRQILVESLLLASLGAVVGIVLAWFGVRAFNNALVASGADIAFWIKIALDLPALLFALGATMASAVLSGLVPALQVSRTPLNEVLKDEGRGSTSLRLGWLSRTVVIAELSLSCVLLVAAGLMVKSIVNMRGASYGFNTANILAVRVPLFEANYPKPEDRGRFYQRLVERLRDKPGIVSVGATTTLPSVGWENGWYAVDGRSYPTENDYPLAHCDVVSEGLFSTLGVRPLDGREFGRFDTPNSQAVVIVNAALAKSMWPHESAIGKRLKLVKSETPDSWRTVVGVMPDVRLYGINNKTAEGIFLPVTQVGAERLSLLLRTRGDPLSYVTMVRNEVMALDKDTPIYFVRTMERAVFLDRFFFDLFAVVFSLFGVCALLLAAVGIYGVISFSVQRRTQEIGVRMALGAQPGTVMSMLLRQGLLQLVIGYALGLPVALLIGRMLSSNLFQVTPTDPVVFGVVVFVLGAMAVLACLVPGRRAMGINPNIALRYA